MKNKDGRTRKKIMKMYQEQKARGIQGFGYVAIGMNGKVTGFQRAQHEHEIQSMLKNEGNAHAIMFHHRQPTSTPNVKECAHPILVSNEKLTYDYYVCHNGVISNDDELKAAHLTEGFAYTTTIETFYRAGGVEYPATEQYNDSEAFAIDLAKVLDKKDTYMGARGSIAFVAIQVDKVTKDVIAVYCGRNINPLLVKKGEFFIISSENKDTSAYTLKTQTLYKIDWKTPMKDITQEHLYFPYYNSAQTDIQRRWRDEDNERNILTTQQRTLPSPYGYHYHKDEEDAFIPSEVITGETTPIEATPEDSQPTEKEKEDWNKCLEKMEDIEEQIDEMAEDIRTHVLIKKEAITMGNTEKEAEALEMIRYAAAEIEALKKEREQILMYGIREVAETKMV